jgi:lipopolysaccharide/colanic/teichoic acid biosynthesis glycosyltransferase
VTGDYMNDKIKINWTASQRLYIKFIKRLIDIALALIAFPFFLLTLIFVAPAIYLEDRGSVFYNADRIGRNGELFKMYKFRSMRMNAPDIRNQDGSTYNSANDPRVTVIGRFIRRSSIDELPQIINVLIGNMSLIGPRPDPPDDMQVYTEAQKKKLAVKPGITGYNQAYFRNSVLQNKKFDHDVYYAYNATLGLDIRILVKTIRTVVFHDNIFNDVAVVAHPDQLEPKTQLKAEGFEIRE